MSVSGRACQNPKIELRRGRLYLGLAWNRVSLCVGLGCDRIYRAEARDAILCRREQQSCVQRGVSFAENVQWRRLLTAVVAPRKKSCRFDRIRSHTAINVSERAIRFCFGSVWLLARCPPDSRCITPTPSSDSANRMY